MTAAETFVIHAIQEWGDPDAKRIAAVQGILDAAGIDATATCWPVFGGIWPSPCTGPDADAATQWLKEVTDTMPRGRLQDEIAHVAACIEAHRAGAVA